ncbi:SGNH/GDSL hydrolase family protein [Bradyrhizobium canariense]|uniref:SGNH/GDSL hydrolase family protein n=1 Tax=Bradyrhizobium canariense TaxID=255045 RepID=UPI000A19734D|nr:GDSL-type esterase/lipase family protein [Bradyrhizobium canariense]OSI32210.1 hypothetical protein BST65_04545 [Bradyrhizobium canariense]OSI36057.1 hypothetical protein BST66_07185 [Bradyrhizobium canariense]OSI48312.1 hypothetical protein BSZ20_07905 [Bradyrhizobium canariense]OSI54880.1 hypothetical protein BST67_06395 [Bradyrhizobium canariense]OSI58676.1 hypothetical protein BSZ15_08705 [Bradyrhizobium canariense]
MHRLLLVVLLVVSNAATFYFTKKSSRPKPWERDPSSLALLAQSSGDPSVLVIGDSLTAGAFLPAEICGRHVFNAGIGGARASTFISFAEDARALGLRPDLIVIALGINDAQDPYRTDFAAAYELLIENLPGAPLALATLAPVGSAAKINVAMMSMVDKTIRETASAKQSTLIDLGAIAQFDTVDGMHPRKDARHLWVSAMTAGIKKALSCN